MKYCYGVDIGGTTVKMGLFEENGNILDKWEIVTRVEDEGKAILPDIAASILEKTKEHGLENTDIIGISRTGDGRWYCQRERQPGVEIQGG